jgi:CelD/BcsL family acetyltransferase involved in cellulose biosynthesis
MQRSQTVLPHPAEIPAGQVMVPISNGLDRFEIRVAADADGFLRGLAAQAEHTARTAFQSDCWLGTWCRTIGINAGTPLLVEIRDRRSNTLVAALPLLSRRVRGARIVEFADCGVSDYNCPILGPATVSDDADLRALWVTLKRALQPVDVIRFSRMPMDIDDRRNPLAMLPWTRPSSINGSVLTLDHDWSHYLKSLESKFRNEIGRCWRIFTGREGGVFKRIDDIAEAERVFAALEHQQAVRLRGQGKVYTLDRPECVGFYRSLVPAGLAGGTVVITALLAGDEVVAALLGLTYQDNFVFLRLSRGAEHWSNCSPGRLVIVKTIEILRSQGFRNFDFSLGEFPYKRRLGTRPRPLRDLVVATSVRGVPLAATAYVRHRARQSDTLRGCAQAIRSLTVSTEATDKEASRS